MSSILIDLENNTPNRHNLVSSVKCDYWYYCLMPILCFLVCDIYFGLSTDDNIIKKNDIGIIKISIGEFLHIRGFNDLICVIGLIISNMKLNITDIKLINWLYCLIGINTLSLFIIGNCIYFTCIKDFYSDAYNYFSVTILFQDYLLFQIILVLSIHIISTLFFDTLNKLILTICYFIIYFPFIFCDFYYGLCSKYNLDINSELLANTNPYINIGLDMYLMVSGICGLLGFILIIILDVWLIDADDDITYYPDETKPLWYKNLYLIKLIINYFGIIWHILGGICFWLNENNWDKIPNVYYYLLASLILKYIGLFLKYLFWCCIYTQYEV